SGCAMTMLRAGIAWHVFALTNSAFHLGLIGAVQFVPALGLLLVAGTLADVWDRRRIMMGAQTLALSCAGVLLWATASDHVTVMLLYGLILLIAVAAAFENPSRAALLPTLVACTLHRRVEPARSGGVRLPRRAHQRAVRRRG